MPRADEVLLFSYDEERRASTAYAVQAAGYACRVAATLEDALLAVCSGPLGAVIVDRGVPHADCKVLRTECALQGIPLLALDGAAPSRAAC